MPKANITPIHPVVVPSKPKLANKDQILYDTMCGDSHSGGWTHQIKPKKEKADKK